MAAVNDPEMDAWAKEKEFKFTFQKYLYGSVTLNPTYMVYVDTPEERKDVMTKYRENALYLVDKINGTFK